MQIKMKSNKHYIRSFLTLLLLMCATITFAYDFAVSNSDGKTIYYNYNSDGSSVSVYKSSSNKYTGTVVIPKTVTYNGRTYSVTSIDYEAFSGCSGLTSVTIPNSVTSIGGKAFFNCSRLTSVTIPNSVTSIGEKAFFNCSGLTSMIIGNSVTSIGYYTFYDCSGLTSVTIGNSVTSISSNAFYGCSRLTSITWNAKNYPAISSGSSNPFYYIITQIRKSIIGDEVTSIPSNMCSGMSNLKTVTIPNSVTSIGSYAFNICI